MSGRSSNASDRSNAVAYRDEAVQTKRKAFKPAADLRGDFASYRRRYPNAPREIRDSVDQAIEYIDKRRAELVDVERSLARARQQEEEDDSDYYYDD